MNRLRITAYSAACLFLLLAGSLPVHAKQSADRWRYFFTDTEGARWFYDSLSATRTGKMVKVLMKSVPRKGTPAFERNRRQLIELGKPLVAMTADNYNIAWMELDCGRRMYKRLGNSLFDAAGNMYYTKTEDERLVQWETPQSLDTIPLLDVCGDVK